MLERNVYDLNVNNGKYSNDDSCKFRATEKD